ncbi:MAG: hypothetical protein HGA76_00285 [Candidatus Firestonebacteria bacterium]|nr:hypothetical protein [Candidatus Firestonebacteria bacterium]
MAERISFITHRGHEIFYVDYASLKGQEFVDVIRACGRELQRCGKTRILLLINLENSVVTREIAGIMREDTAVTKQFVYKLAIVGANAFHRILASLVISATNNKLMHYFKEMEAAKDWLIE